MAGSRPRLRAKNASHAAPKGFANCGRQVISRVPLRQAVKELACVAKVTTTFSRKPRKPIRVSP